jgi:hypothetical protein
MSGWSGTAEPIALDTIEAVIFGQFCIISVQSVTWPQDN